MDRRLIVLGTLGAILVIGGGVVLAVALTGPTTTLPAGPTATFPPPPDVQITPPFTLDELAQRYPALAHLLTNSELDSVLKDLMVAWQEKGETAALDLARKRGLLDEQDRFHLTLVLDTDDPDPLVAQLEAVGVEVLAAYREQIDVAIPVSLVQTQVYSGDPGAIFSQLTELEHVIRLRFPHRATSDATVSGEGVWVSGADLWHAAGVSGKGIRVGVLDLGFDGYADLLGDELPADVAYQFFGESPDPGDRVHGTACAEVVHEMAPDAALYLVSYDGRYVNLGPAVEWLLAQDVHIITHSVGGTVGPMDGSGSNAAIADQAAAHGVLWINSAGNEARTHYRATFADKDGDGLHEFASEQEVMTLRRDPFVPEGELVAVALNWDDWENADQDYELLLYDADLEELAASRWGQAGQVGDEPVEYLEYDLPADELAYVVIQAHDADRAVTFDLYARNAEIEFSTPDHSLTTPADARGALTVGAVNWWSDELASYSSQGPANDGRLKPEISAPTGVSNVTYEVFHGTSASAPHVAGAAALLWSARPDWGRDEMVVYLLENSLDLGLRGADHAFGWGRLSLGDPATFLASPATATPTPSPLSSPTPTEIPATPHSLLLPTQTPPPLPTPTPTPTPRPTFAPPPSPTPPSVASASPPTALIVLGVAAFGSGSLMLGGSLLGWIVYQQRPHKRTISAQSGSPDPAFEAGIRAASPSRTVACPHCGRSNRPQARFCPGCGSTLQPSLTVSPNICSHCRAPLRPGAQFCAACGRAVDVQCRSCGAALRRGGRFCPVCGREVA